MLKQKLESEEMGADARDETKFGKVKGGWTNFEKKAGGAPIKRSTLILNHTWPISIVRSKL